MTTSRNLGFGNTGRAGPRAAQDRLSVLTRVAMAFAAAVALGCGSALASGPDDHWELRGTVVTETRAPASGVFVTVRNFPISKTVKTAADGSFSLDVPNPPSWGGFVLATDSDGERQAIYVPQPDWREPTQRRPVRLILKNAGKIPVTVNDEAGRLVAGAVVGACVGLFDIAKETSDSAGRAVLQVPADAALQYIFAAKPGVGLDYFAYAAAGSNSPNPYLMPPASRRPVTFVLNGAKTAKLRFTDANYRPLAGVHVAPWYFRRPKKGSDLNVAGMETFAQMTDAKGMATFDFIPPDNEGRVWFSLNPPEYAVPNRPVFDPKGSSRVISEVLLRKEIVRGHVALADGKPGADAEVLVAGEGYGDHDFQQQTKCDARGQFKLLVDPNMFYAFVATQGDSIAPRRTHVVRAGQTIAPVQLVLQPGTRIHGRWTRNADNRSVARRSIALNEWVINNDYAAIPQEQRIANPDNVNKMLLPKILRWAQTDDQGSYEIYVAPGTYYFAPYLSEGDVPYATKAIDRKDFVITITDQRDVQLDFRSEPMDLRPINGRVVLKTDPKRGVPDAPVTGITSDKHYSSDQIRAVTDAQGSFRGRRSPCALLFHAATADRSLSGIVRVSADAGDVVVPIGPTASAHGRVIDRSTGEPLANRAIKYGLPWKWREFSSWQFGGKTRTDTRGDFDVKGLTPGWKWELVLPDEHYRVIGVVAPQSAERVELGDLKLSEPKHRDANAKHGP